MAASCMQSVRCAAISFPAPRNPHSLNKRHKQAGPLYVCRYAPGRFACYPTREHRRRSKRLVFITLLHSLNVCLWEKTGSSGAVATPVNRFRGVYRTHCLLCSTVATSSRSASIHIKAPVDRQGGQEIATCISPCFPQAWWKCEEASNAGC